jgi:plasmid maintenance system antidote protein VapI
MRAKNFTQLKEVAAELGFSNPYISDLNSGKSQFTDELAIKLAKEIGLDPLEVIISLQAVRAKTPATKAAWYDALKKYCASTGTALALVLMANGSLNLEPDLTAHNVAAVLC